MEHLRRTVGIAISRYVSCTRGLGSVAHGEDTAGSRAVAHTEDRMNPPAEATKYGADLRQRICCLESKHRRGSLRLTANRAGQSRKRDRPSPSQFL